MKHRQKKLTDQERQEYEDLLKQYQPYDDDDPELRTLDGPDEDIDWGRWAATFARKILEEEK